MRWVGLVLLLAAGCGFIGLEAVQGDGGLGDVSADGLVDGVDVRGDDGSDRRVDADGVDIASDLPVDASDRDAIDLAMDGSDLMIDASADDAVFVSPDGTDGALGTRAAPLRRLSEAAGRLEPGSTLVLLPGRYGTAEGTGLLDIACGSAETACDGGPCASGTVEAPITVRADVERTARFVAGPGDADSMVVVRGCAHYRIEGLTIVGADIDGNSHHSLRVSESSFVEVRRNLFSRNNRFVNVDLILVFQSERILIEENELYDFHREGVSIFQSADVEVRRNYANARSFADIAGGLDSLNPATGDAAFGCSHSARCLFENNLSDGDVDTAFRIVTSLDSPVTDGEGDDERFFGNLMVGAGRGIVCASGCGGAASCGTRDELAVDRPLLRDNVFIGTGVEDAVELVGTREAELNRNTFLDSRIRLRVGSGNASIMGSVRVTNNATARSAGLAMFVTEQTSSAIDFNNTFGPNPQISVDDGSVSLDTNTALDPENGVCLHRNRTESPLQTLGEGGLGVGATVVDRYEGGALTDVPLWDVDGSYPCGAVVAGINDTGPRCTNAHERFNVGPCPVE
ncbi:MAG: right-handed parallel beta-helix repeat-containing protein [Myxococcota bacterium]